MSTEHRAVMLAHLTAQAEAKALPHVPGLYPGISYQDYARIEGVRASELRGFEQSPAHAREAMLHPTTSEAKEFGQAWHCAVLEPERFSAEYVRGIEHGDRRFKAEKERWSAFVAENAGRTVLLREEWDAIAAMQRVLADHPLAAALMASPGPNEVVALWDDAKSGLRCKGRMDAIRSYLGWTWVIDLKSTEDASPRGWPRQAANWGYAEPAAYYLDGLNTLAPAERRFLWVAQEKVPPYALAIHEPDAATLEEGRRRYRRHLAAYAKAMSTNDWPAYEVAILPATLPRWAFTEGQETE